VVSRACCAPLAKNDKGEPGFALSCLVVGADGIEPPTYAL
jgi:hypothetical protein